MVSDVEVTDIKRVVFDEDPARFDDIAHENVKHASGLQRVVIVEFHLEKAAMCRIHRSLVEFLGIHFAKALESLDLDTPSTNFLDHLEDPRDGENLMGGVTINDLEERRLAIGVVFYLKALSGKFTDESFDSLGFVNLHQTGTAPADVLVDPGCLLGASILTVLTLRGFGIKEVKVDVGSREIAKVGLVVKILHGLIIASTDDNEVGGKTSLAGSGCKIGLKLATESADGFA